MGCAIKDQKDEAFPIFPALLNAVHQKGIKVRLMTNNYTQTTCRGMINPLDWFYLNGIQIHLYSTTTFMHSKVVIIDQGKRTSISSVNFSKTSFTKNREAGVVIEDCSCAALDLYQSVFQYDWDNGFDYQIDANYSDEDIATIKDSALMSIHVYSYPKIAGAYVTKKVAYNGVVVTRGYTSPDGALDVIMSDLSNVKSSLQVNNPVTLFIFPGFHQGFNHQITNNSSYSDQITNYLLATNYFSAFHYNYNVIL